MSTPEPLPDVEDTASPYSLVPTPATFVRNLAKELDGGEVKLPSFPEVAMRVQRVLEDPRGTALQVAQVLGSDAALAARVLRIANSATFNPTGKPITDLQTAVGRLGGALVRSAAVSFAFRQSQEAGRYPALWPTLQELWRKGTLVAAIAYVLARETGAAKPDAALVTGLLHNVGRLYILERIHDKSQGVPDAAVWDQILHDWHPRLGRLILEHWKFDPAIVAAVADQNAWNRPISASDRLTDVLVAATSLVPCVFCRDLIEHTVASVPSFERLGLAAAECNALLTRTAQQVKSLRDALAG